MSYTTPLPFICWLSPGVAWVMRMDNGALYGGVGWSMSPEPRPLKPEPANDA